MNLEGGLDLERDFSSGGQPVELVGIAGHRLGIIAEQEWRLVGAGQDAILALAHDGHATISRQRGPQPVGCLSERQLAKLARPRLDPKLGVCDLGDEFRVACLGLLAEKDLGRPARLGLRPDPDEQEMGAGLGGQAQDDRRSPRWRQPIDWAEREDSWGSSPTGLLSRRIRISFMIVQNRAASHIWPALFSVLFSLASHGASARPRRNSLEHIIRRVAIPCCAHKARRAGSRATLRLLLTSGRFPSFRCDESLSLANVSRPPPPIDLNPFTTEPNGP